ncbi:Protein CBG14903 [Caenorhabditis briggsae]|uniref:Protein kinase domain-containing protein n=2 Tax=Caenorhabditis briggsae TaxID=6238 RepID=A0AAE9DSM2_CAEBR|nr:Protein CBG14903 [Caenorhabditis briggsae]ULU10007.1 hypothetical protein L3Y34_014391 [Caenorhabditis briggsae]UMM10940.1 hypothetical protein L5515_000474 [Caenorhabditis briggsae]CAP33308.1 Protein CBG14903 [Caenorhabditis briggsae]
MSEEDDKPDKQVESVRLDIGEEVADKDGRMVWRAIRELGKGAFGTVYHVVNKTTKQEAALKIERMTAGDNLLKIEREIMKAMQPETTAIHIFDDGIYNDFRFIVMTLCGPDLQKIADLMNNTFSPETIIRVCIRTLLAIKTLHEYEYVHRDLKPCNFAVDYNTNSLHVYLFDYGMARKYARKENNRWYLRRPRQPAQFRGTIRYCSLNMHKRKELGRIDDIWSWFFMMMEMHKPLPWNATTNPDKVEAWKEVHLKEFLAKDPFLNLFDPLIVYMNSVEYPDRPDYAKIFGILHEKLKELNGKLSGPMEYDPARINALVAETGESARPKEASKMEDETAVMNFLSNSFQKVVVPGGPHLILGEYVDFFGNLEPKKAKEEKTDENKKHHHRLSAAHVKNKMLGKPKQPGSGPGKKEGHSSMNSRVSLQKTKTKGSKK